MSEDQFRTRADRIIYASWWTFITVLFVVLIWKVVQL